MMNIRLFFFLLLSISFVNMTSGQVLENDTLLEKTYDYFRSYFSAPPLDSLESRTIAQKYVLKAKKEKDTVELANAYFFLSETYSPKNRIVFMDSIIALTSNYKESKEFPSLAYLQKANIYYQIGKLKKAIDFYHVALQAAELKDNRIQILAIKGNIGTIKISLGELEEGLEICREYVDYIEKSNLGQKDFYQIEGYLALANAYIYNKKQDSASFYLKKGLDKTLQLKDTIRYSNYLVRIGINEFYKENFTNARDSIQKGKKNSKSPNLDAIANLYLGKCYIALNETEKSISSFDKVDDYLSNNQNVMPLLLQAYEPLIQYHKENKNPKIQLYYVEQLLKNDSILKSNNLYISKKIAAEFDIPVLIREKDFLLELLRRENLNKKNRLSTLYILLAIALVLAIGFVYRYYVLRKRFKKVMFEFEKKKNILTVDKKIDNLPEELTSKIIQKLEDFENKQKFTKYYTLNSLSKELKTNSSYLSKVINSQKGTNFSKYLNDLRIDYSIKCLKEDNNLRSYTIEAIAKEVGFNTAQSFSTAFNKKTGLYPSFFIRQLEKNRAS